MKHLKHIPCVILSCLVSLPVAAVQINFTGGNVVLNGGGTRTTNNSAIWDDVDYYEEGGFKLDFIQAGGGGIFATHIGDYYSAGNDVIHGHWDAGADGDVTEVVVTKLDNTAFDLNYFVLTSNTEARGANGGPASGNEQTYINASTDGVTISYSMLLPSETWGFPATQIYLDSHFDNIKTFTFDVKNVVNCFGMDNFYIDEPPPNPVSEPSTLSLLAIALLGLELQRQKKGQGQGA